MLGYSQAVTSMLEAIMSTLHHIDISTLDAPESLEFAHKDMIEEALWERLVNRIMKDEEVPRELAERIMDQALGFLMLCKLDPNGRYSPSPLVDIGWHTFILYTRPYAAFCRNLVGHFIHHEPTDEPEIVSSSGGPYRTVEALKAHGLAVDEALWACFCATDCSNCNGGQGCQCGSCNY